MHLAEGKIKQPMITNYSRKSLWTHLSKGKIKQHMITNCSRKSLWTHLAECKIKQPMITNCCRKSLWTHLSEGKAQREDFELVDKTGDGKTQKWRHKWDASEGCAMGCSSDSLTSEMTVRKIDGQGNVAIPIKFYSNYYVDEMGDFYTNLDFKYEVDSSFTISDYCTN